MSTNPLELRGNLLETQADGSSTHRSTDNTPRLKGSTTAAHHNNSTNKSSAGTAGHTGRSSVNIAAVMSSTETTIGSGNSRPLTRQGTMKGGMRLRKKPEKLRGKAKFRVGVLAVLAALRLRTTLTFHESATLSDYYDRAGGLKTFSRIRAALADLGQNLDDDELNYTLCTTLGWRGDGHVLSYAKFKTIFLMRKRLLRLSEAQVDDTRDTFKALGGSQDKTATIGGQKLKDSADIFGLTVDMDGILATMNKQATDEINYEEFQQMFRARLSSTSGGTQSSSPPPGKDQTPRNQVMLEESPDPTNGGSSRSTGETAWWMSVGDDSWWGGLDTWMGEGKHEPKRIQVKEETPKQTLQGTLEELLADTTALESRRSKLLSSTTSTTKRNHQNHQNNHYMMSPPSPSSGAYHAPPVMLQASMLGMKREVSGSAAPYSEGDNSTSTPFHHQTSGASMVISPSGGERGMTGELFVPSPMNNLYGAGGGIPPTPSFLKGPAHLQHTRGSVSIRSVGSSADEAFGPRAMTVVAGDSEDTDQGTRPPHPWNREYLAAEEVARSQVEAAEIDLANAEKEMEQFRAAARNERQKNSPMIGASTVILNQMRDGHSAHQPRPSLAFLPKGSTPFLQRMQNDIKNKRASSAKTTKAREDLKRLRKAFDVSYEALRPKDCFQDPPPRIKRDELLDRSPSPTSPNQPRLNPTKESLSRRPSFDFSRPTTAQPTRQPSILRGPNAARPSSAGTFQHIVGLQDTLRSDSMHDKVLTKKRPASAMAQPTRQASGTSADSVPRAAPPVSFGVKNLAKWIRGGQHADRPSLHAAK